MGMDEGAFERGEMEMGRIILTSWSLGLGKGGRCHALCLQLLNDIVSRYR